MSPLSLTTLFRINQTTDDKHHFETSWILPPAILASLRGLISLYIFTSIFIFWGWYGTHDDLASIGRSFSFHLADILGHWLLHAIRCHSYSLLCTNRSLGSPRPLATELSHTTQPIVCNDHNIPVSRYGCLLGSHFYSTVVQGDIHQLAKSALLMQRKAKDEYKQFKLTIPQISQHGLNSLFALLEIILPATPPHPFIAIPFLFLMLLLFLCVAYITHETQGWYPYTFLDVGDHGQKSKLVVGYCFGILAAVLIFFHVSWALIHLRCRLTYRRIKRARRDPLRPHDVFDGVVGTRGEQSNEVKGALGLGE
ncbi:FAR-17a/AIG1-like protein [Penicillium cf. griseofulvum]|uniref:FAR-17a/AIG1-like protein n=1 Tax=Penicillium cf. griseofulvum TaxID=2972120 RepID=A0A9W9T658_9EURO|nr:FAR-17a/AIG1-like protein [Penicillium cf. griseofulvum]KAJ5422287.1 FAR-17a/AIG1-like protein [Penicillium cf. griseofulvum]KAJ5428470.1 FAR-17a/AIG1-like protein [Penicillium cf. griseofulvum]